MGKRVVDDTSLTAVADAIRHQLGSEETLVFPEGFVDGVTQVYNEGHHIGNMEGWESGYQAGYQAGFAADRNLFDINDPVFIANIPTAVNYRPRIENGVLYSGGIIGITFGTYACVPVQAGDIITFSANFAGDGVFSIELEAGTGPVNNVFTANKTLIALMNQTPDGTKFWAVQIPDGYDWFGFSAIGKEKYDIQMSNIVITRQNNALGEQAAAYNILTGVAE